MTKRQTIFQESWLNIDDPHNPGQKFSFWASKDLHCASKVCCRLCNKSVNIQNRGVSGLGSHSAGDSHKKLVKAKENVGSIEKFLKSKEGCQNETPTNADIVRKAEIRWILHCVESQYSFLSNEHVVDVFSSMFPMSSSVTKYMSLGPNKISYMLRDGIHPYFKQLITKDLSDEPFSICIDEANKGGPRLAIVVRYVPENSWTPVNLLLDLPSLERTDAEHILSTTLSSLHLHHLQTQNVVGFMSDSCPTMRGEKSGVFKRLKQVSPKCVDLGGCSLHHVHNAVKYAMMVFDSKLEEFISDVYCYFNNSHAAKSAYKKFVELEDIQHLKFLRHIDTRWIQILLVVQRLLTQWQSLEAFFRFLPSDLESERSVKIREGLSDPLNKAFLLFVSEVLPALNKFEKLLQKEDCQIHSLLDDMVSLYRDFLLRFLKSGEITVMVYDTNVKNRKIWLPNSGILIGESTSAFVSELNETVRTAFFVKVVAFFEEAAARLVHYLPFENVVLRWCRLLSPGRRTSKNLEKWGKNLATHFQFSNADITELVIELRSYGSDVHLFDKEDLRIEEYWKSVTHNGRYPLLRKLVRMIITLPHGNAPCERVFSILKDTYRDKRVSLVDDTIRALLIVKCYLQAHNIRCHEFPISPQLLMLASNAYSSYKERLRVEARETEERKKFEQENRIREVLEEERQKSERRKQLQNEMEKVESERKTELARQERARQMMREAQKLEEEAARILIENDKKRDQLLLKKNREEGRLLKRAISEATKNCPSPKKSKTS